VYGKIYQNGLAIRELTSVTPEKVDLSKAIRSLLSEPSVGLVSLFVFLERCFVKCPLRHLILISSFVIYVED
jgi:hypothetical protein